MTARPAGATRFLWRLKRSVLKLRWSGLLGLALMAFAAAFYALAVAPQRTRVAAVEAETAHLSARLSSRGPLPEQVTKRSQLANFYGFFPLAESVPELLGTIERAAQGNGLRLEKGEYRLTREADFPLARYQVTLPLRGSYGDVRGFVNDVLDAVPSAALEELTLKREVIGDPALEARVRFALFLGAQ